MKKLINKLPKCLFLIQGIPYFCMFGEMIELILESNIFKMHINAGFITTIWCFYCAYCVHIVGIISVVSSILALVMNFKLKTLRKKYIIYTMEHILMAWFTWFWFNALMSVQEQTLLYYLDVGGMYFFFGLIYSDTLSGVATFISSVAGIAHIVLFVLQIVEMRKIKKTSLEI